MGFSEEENTCLNDVFFPLHDYSKLLGTLYGEIFEDIIK